jgi:biopolymer transport protein ExbD
VLRNHVIGDGTRPVNQIMLAVEQLKADRKNNPTAYNDSTFQKELNKIKKGETKQGKVSTLTIVIKPTDNSSYKNMMDILDEMQILNIGTYVIDKITPDDTKLLEEKGVKM